MEALGVTDEDLAALLAIVDPARNITTEWVWDTVKDWSSHTHAPRTRSAHTLGSLSASPQCMELIDLRRSALQGFPCSLRFCSRFFFCSARFHAFSGGQKQRGEKGKGGEMGERCRLARFALALPSAPSAVARHSQFFLLVFCLCRSFQWPWLVCSITRCASMHLQQRRSVFPPSRHSQPCTAAHLPASFISAF